MINTENIKQAYTQYLSNQSVENRNKVITESLPMVEQITSRFCNSRIIEKNDLYQEGVLGIFTAIEKCTDAEDFANRLYGYIQGKVLRYSIKQHPVSSNQYSQQKASKINSFVQQFILDHEREPSNSEIQEGTGIKIKNLVTFHSLNNATSELKEEIVEGKDHLEESLKKEDLERMKHIMNKSLSKYESQILSMKYGLHGPKMTLETIGNLIEPKICKQRVDQIHKNALSKLKKVLVN